ncbi:trehalase [Escherichia albertii]|nr:trehalase [Escherichia albertii]
MIDARTCPSSPTKNSVNFCQHFIMFICVPGAGRRNCSYPATS